MSYDSVAHLGVAHLSVPHCLTGWKLITAYLRSLVLERIMNEEIDQRNIEH
jgi:hypothetical protein